MYGIECYATGTRRCGSRCLATVACFPVGRPHRYNHGETWRNRGARKPNRRMCRPAAVPRTDGRLSNRRVPQELLVELAIGNLVVVVRLDLVHHEEAVT